MTSEGKTLSVESSLNAGLKGLFLPRLGESCCEIPSLLKRENKAAPLELGSRR